MKGKYIAGIISIIGFCAVTFGTGHGQSARCIILEKSDNMALVSCDGEPARYMNLGGRADRYNVGESLDVSKTPNVKGTGRGTSYPEGSYPKGGR